MRVNRSERIGTRYGRLVVVEHAYVRGGHSHWKCVCDCGVEKIINGNNLFRGKTKSCGCWYKESRRRRLVEERVIDHPLYRTWQGMKTRCYNPNHPGFKNYGERGIAVDPKWKESFRAFAKDIEEAIGLPPPGASLDRINNDGDYELENVRWATAQQQAMNRRTNNLGGVGVHRGTGTQEGSWLVGLYFGLSLEEAEALAREMRPLVRKYLP